VLAIALDTVEEEHRPPRQLLIKGSVEGITFCGGCEREAEASALEGEFRPPGQQAASQERQGGA
jgi:hypothetical protein